MKKEIVKTKAIYQDQRIAEEFCNFRCDYCEGFCPSGYSLRKDNKGNLQVPDEWYEKIRTLPIQVEDFFKEGIKLQNFYNLSLEIMEKAKQKIETDILKISGGEITINNDLVNFVENIHNKYLSIQILTNGFNLNKEDIDKYSEMGNISFQISIDGATAESNYAKSHNPNITEKVLKNIEYLVEKNIGVEINCVLTKYNTDKILDFLERFKDADNFIIVPRPVRGEPKKTLNFSNSQILKFEKDINENYEKYSKILPPKKYLDRLINIMKNDERNIECYIPYFVKSIDGYGNLEECPIGLITQTTSNILDNTSKNIDSKIFNDTKLCYNCTNQYEMFNLYVEGEITKEELKKLPSLNSDIIISHIDEIKEEIVKKKIKNKLEKLYDIKVNKIEKSKESTDGNVYIIYSLNNKYIVKIYDQYTHVESMIKLHNYLLEEKINAPTIIYTIDQQQYVNIFNNRYLVIYSFVEGNPISYDSASGKLNTDIIIKIAKNIKKIHLATKHKNEFGFKYVPFIEEKTKESNCILHFDLTKDNILINENNIGFIDFDDAKYGDEICDIAILISNFFFSKKYGVDIDGMNLFINEYYNNQKEKIKEATQLIKEYALKWIDYILDGNQFDASDIESLEVRKKLIIENL